MGVQRLNDIPGFNIDRVAAAAGDDPDVLRLENLDTDLPPPAEAIEATRAAIGTDDANSWLPFTGRDDLKEEVAAFIERRGGPRYDGRREIVITCGEGDAMLDALFCLTDPGDEVIVADPTYAGMINRVRLVGAVPRLVPLGVADGEWRLDLDALSSAVTARTRVVFVNNPSFPTGWVASGEEWDAIASLCREHDIWLLYLACFEGVLFDGRTVTHPAALDGMRDRTVTVGCPTLAPRSRSPTTDSQPRTRSGRGGATRRCDNSTACPPFARRARGRCSSTWRRWGSTARKSPMRCWSRRSPRRRCEAGAARSRTAMSASCSATNRSNGSSYSGSAFETHSPGSVPPRNGLTRARVSPASLAPARGGSWHAIR